MNGFILLESGPDARNGGTPVGIALNREVAQRWEDAKKGDVWTVRTFYSLPILPLETVKTAQ